MMTSLASNLEIPVDCPAMDTTGYNKQELQRLWKEEPQAAQQKWPSGILYAIEKGENLASLGEAFGIPWQHIAKATMGTDEPTEINDYLKNNGGRQLPSGYWAFGIGQKIIIPPPEQKN